MKSQIRFFISFSLVIVPIHSSIWAEEIVPSSEWSNKSLFFEHGCPLITKRTEDILLKNPTHVSFIPQYVVIYNNVDREGNLYISLGGVQEKKFHLYGETHPTGPHYAMNTKSSVIQKCTNTKECSEMDECKIGDLYADGDEISETTVFLSWKLNKKHLIILFQYMKRIIKCQDFNSFSLQKVVMEGPTPEDVKTVQRDIRYIPESKPELSPIFPKNSLYVYSSRCFKCTFEITLHCGEKNIRPTNFNNKNEILVNYGNVIAKGWEKTVFQTLDGNQNCSLTFKPQYDGEDVAAMKFWAIALIISESIYDVKGRLSRLQDEKTTLKKSDQNKTDIKSDNQHECNNLLRIFMTITITAILAAIITATIIIGTYYLKKCRKSKNNQPPKEELEEEENNAF